MVLTLPPLSLADFACNVLGRPLYPYQLEIAETILNSVLHGRGQVFTVMMARQSGKNQLSAVLEAFLLAYMLEGTIVKAAPTFSPQITHSRLRLLTMLEAPGLHERVWQSQGNIVGLAPEGKPALVKSHGGPRVMFFSANPESNVVGATADLLLEIDEAQDVEEEKFDRDFRPMAAVKNATTVLYGTAWSESTLLAHQRAVNLELEQRTGVRRHFEHDWRTLAALNPAYRAFVEQEIARLGEEHIAIQTQYFLHPVSGTDRLLNSMQRTLLRGQHSWCEQPQDDDEWYIAGMDVAGEERALTGKSGEIRYDAVRQAKVRRDSTVITIGRVCASNRLGLPEIEIVHQEWWTGKPYLEQYATTVALVEHWGIRKLVVDATGLGAMLASLLYEKLGDQRVLPFTFSRPAKTKLAYQLLSLINSHRLRLYALDSAPAAVGEECWKQICRARYRLPEPDALDFYVDPREGHDDFLMSLALLTEAIETNALSSCPSAIIHSRRDDDGSRF